MSDRALIIRTVRDVLQDKCTPQEVAAAEGSWQLDVWTTLVELGVTAIGVPEEAGGVGGSVADGVAVVRVAAEYAAAIPLAETLLASWISAGAGLRRPDSATVAVSGAISITDLRGEPRLSIDVRRVPWATVVSTLVLADEESGLVAAVPIASCAVEPGRTLAGEPCDRVVFEGELNGESIGTLAPCWRNGGIVRLGALLRAAQIAGALDRILTLTTQYIAQREQFGRPISAFQAVQHQIADLAGVTTAIGIGVDAAATAALRPGDELALEAIGAYASAWCGRGAAIAHQLHGAIGFTEEHQLHLFTRRLWSWRDDFGSERFWSKCVATRLATAGADSVWPALTATGAPA